jgi:hypothetical protein
MSYDCVENHWYCPTPPQNHQLCPINCFVRYGKRTNTAVYTVNENHRTYDITAHTSLSISLE